MTTKLTLSIDEETIKNAKRVSVIKGKSISKMVEEYLNSEIEKVKIKTNPMEEIERIISKHRSTLTLPKDGNYKKLIRELKYQDYLNSK